MANDLSVIEGCDQRLTSSPTGRVKVLATGDHWVTCVYQLLDIGLRNAVAFHVDLHPHIGEADRLFAGVAGAPYRGDVEVALEFEFELLHLPAAMHGIGVQADRQARAERCERSFGRIWRRVVAQQPRRLIDDIWFEIADVVEVTEAAFRDGLALQRLDRFRIGLAGSRSVSPTRPCRSGRDIR
jgi:hypothetical protein